MTLVPVPYLPPDTPPSHRHQPITAGPTPALCPESRFDESAVMKCKCMCSWSIGSNLLSGYKSRVEAAEAGDPDPGIPPLIPCPSSRTIHSLGESVKCKHVNHNISLSELVHVLMVYNFLLRRYWSGSGHNFIHLISVSIFVFLKSIPQHMARNHIMSYPFILHFRATTEWDEESATTPSVEHLEQSESFPPNPPKYLVAATWSGHDSNTVMRAAN